MTADLPRVLVVDDNRDAADTTADVLRLAGCRVAACYDGETALAEADRAWPDVCLLDLNMPGMAGDALGRALRERAAAAGRRLPVLVAVTANGDADARRRTAAAGYVLHLVKPVAASDLVAVTSALGPRPLATTAGGGGATPDCNAG